MAKLNGWNPAEPGEYKTRLVRIADEKYPYIGSDMLLEWIPTDSASPHESALYRLSSLPDNPEPRGVCLLATRIGEQSTLPSEVVLRLPDIGNLEKRSHVERYLRPFGPELKAELEILARLDGVSDIAHRLPFEDVVPRLRIPVGEVLDQKLPVDQGDLQYQCCYESTLRERA